MEKLRKLFRRNPERLKYAGEFSVQLDQQLQSWTRVAAFISIFAWVNFAFDTDKRLHPEFTELLYFRLALSVIGFIVFVASFIPSLQKHKALSLKILMGYVMLATSWFTGRLAVDANYVSGLQIVVMIPIAAPVSRFLFVLAQVSSIVVFLLSVIIYKPNLSTPAAAYSMNNLLISYVIAVAFAFMLDKIRFDSFMKTKNIEIKNSEIEAQMKRVHALKTQQDGDYFLTAQLLQPLAVNATTASRIAIEFLTEQKKKFQFKKWESEIGGDISAANTVVLRGQKYIAFMNGDAMGKSIQGAGGALVAGTIFKSYLHRTKQDDESRYTFPEQWLRDCHQELHHVMASFDGRMLVSAVIGLIDESNGFLYYINAEHPWIALWRDGKASFIEDELTLRKFGMPETDEVFRIKTFSMAPADSLFIGSDGRDDLALGIDESGNSIINSDETLFLRVIEKSEGELEVLYEDLKRAGEITDDLSLVKITYQGQAKQKISRADLTQFRSFLEKKELRLALGEIERLYSENPLEAEVIFEFMLLNSKAKKFTLAAEVGEKFCRENPSDLRIIYLTSRALKFAGAQDRNLLRRAADYAERVALRAPRSLTALVNLADIYRRLGRTELAEDNLKKAQAIDSENRVVKKLESLLTVKT